MNNGRSLTLHNNQKQSKTRELTKVSTLSFTNTRGDYEGDVASTMRDDRMQVGARALCLRGKCSGVQRERRVACQGCYRSSSAGRSADGERASSVLPLDVSVSATPL